MTIKLLPPDGAKVIDFIGHPDVCRHAYFQPDKPIELEPGDFFELLNGQWILVRGNEEHVIEGKWNAGDING